MEYPEHNYELIKSYWERYVAGYEEIPEHLEGLDDRILQSWKRSKLKANPFETNPPQLNNTELEHLTKEKQDLIKIAVPYMIRFYEIAKNTTQNVILTDAEGKQLKNVSANNKDLLKIMDHASVTNGSIYAEDVSGTSSVSLSLYEDTPILLRGYEHYRRIYHNLACFSLPIHSLGNKQVGCICITGPLEKYQPLVASAGLMMVHAIENELRLTQANFIMDVITQNFSQGFLLFNSDHEILQFNEKAKKLLRISQDMTGHSFEEYFTNKFQEIIDLQRTQKQKKFKYILIQKNGLQIALSVLAVPVKENNQEDLFLLIFTSMDEANKETSMKVGYTARYYFKDIIGDSKEIKKVKELGSLASNSSSGVLISGESGTGRELLAQAIHNGSVRKDFPFITIRCGSIPKELIETELFGDQNDVQLGKLELADGGTLFLDEIEHLSVECQVKLLNFLNTKVISNGKKLDVRIIACSQKDLLHLVSTNQFRSDLYYKLNVITIVLPPLRRRRMDIRPLINYYTDRYRKLLRKDVTTIEKRCMEVLLNYNWPGNVRELESTIEHLINAASGHTMKFSDLPDEIVTGYLSQKYIASDNEIQGILSPETIEYGEIIKCLKREHGHMKTTAALLHMPLSTLYRKCNKYKIDPKNYREW